jgi:hypothetical protein
VTPRSSERERNEDEKKKQKPTHPARNLYGRNVKKKKIREKGLSQPEANPYGVVFFTPIMKCRSSRDENGVSMLYKETHANAVGS